MYAALLYVRVNDCREREREKYHDLSSGLIGHQSMGYLFELNLSWRQCRVWADRSIDQPMIYCRLAQIANSSLSEFSQSVTETIVFFLTCLSTKTKQTDEEQERERNSR